MIRVDELRERLAGLPDHHEITAGALGHPEEIVELRDVDGGVQLVVGDLDE